MEDKISRICWNTEGWKFPSGSKGKSINPDLFESKSKFGYGHEEWLFDKSRIINGHHYAFLQSLGPKSNIHVKSNKHVNKTYNISLFTITGGTKYFVGVIKNTYCISKDESKKIHKIYKQNGWLKEMVEEIERAGANPKPFKESSPEDFFNIRFNFENVIEPDELEEISREDNNIPIRARYQLNPKKSDFKIVTEPSEDEGGGRLRNTESRNRTYKGESHFDQYHNKIQNAIYELLKDSYNNEYKKVWIEKDRVDVKAKTHNDKLHYFEVKTDSPKLSIRNGLGQIMEYSYWPDLEKAEKLIIVSDNTPNSETKKYLAHIRDKFKIPIYYKFFNMEQKILSEDF